jgi:hypothetical protein
MHYGDTKVLIVKNVGLSVGGREGHAQLVLFYPPACLDWYY